MIKENELLEAIAECQGERNPNANTCRNLAAFYTILDHLYGDKKEDTKSIGGYSYGSDPIEYNNGSEFLQAISGRDINEIMPIIDELMETLKIINPRLYAGVMRKLNLI